MLQKVKSPLFLLFKNAVLFGLLVFILSYANLYYFSIRVFHKEIEAQVGIANVSSFLLKEALSLLFLLILCSYCGFAFSKRNGLPGMVGLKELKDYGLKYYFPGAFSLVILSYFIFDRFFMIEAPQYFPKIWYWALTIPFASAFLEETVFRFGMLTVLVGGIRRWLHPLWANFAVSLFYALVMTKKTFGFVDIPIELNWLGITGLLGSFLTCFLLGWIYIKKGLIPAIFLHFCLSCKYLIYACVL